MIETTTKNNKNTDSRLSLTISQTLTVQLAAKRCSFPMWPSRRSSRCESRTKHFTPSSHLQPWGPCRTRPLDEWSSRFVQHFPGDRIDSSQEVVPGFSCWCCPCGTGNSQAEETRGTEALLMADMELSG
jgi:hypothetical protein